MSTRGKLILLVIITCLANASSLLIDRLMTRPIRSIQVETEYLQNMLDGLLMYSAQVNRLDSESFRDQTERVIETREALDGLFSDVSGARMLPELNETIQTSLEGFLVYQNDIEMAHQSLFNQSEMIVATADRLIGKDKPFTLDSLLAASEDEDDEVMLSVTRLASIAFVVDGTITKARTDLETQYRIISDEVLVMERRANRLVLVIILLVFVFSFAIALIIANVLAGRIKKIEIGISRMKEGDLADRIEIHSRDEMGRLSRNVNDFTKALGKSMLRIKDTSGRNIAIKEQLLSSVQNVNEVTSTVGASAHSISAEMTGLDGTVGIGTEAVQTVKDRLVRLEEVIQEEVSMIEETSAAITQMIALVSTVGDITTRKKNSMAQLV